MAGTVRRSGIPERNGRPNRVAAGPCYPVISPREACMTETLTASPRAVDEFEGVPAVAR